jgi:hypothetical protein
MSFIVRLTERWCNIVNAHIIMAIFQKMNKNLNLYCTHTRIPVSGEHQAVLFLQVLVLNFY